ncbi:MAG: hypothetical protein D6791_17335 [Chloroflexi bacterium]|nr:MAG: hypothetical protein D6791_17335 [Chloroflexota bacterium]
MRQQGFASELCPVPAGSWVPDPRLQDARRSILLEMEATDLYQRPAKGAASPGVLRMFVLRRVAVLSTRNALFQIPCNDVRMPDRRAQRACLPAVRLYTLVGGRVT